MIFRTLILILFTCLGIAYAAPTQWHTLRPGLQYTQVYQTPELPLGAIHAFKINLKNFKLELTLTKNNERPLVLVKDLVQTHKALVGINGGFFSPKLIPLGLRIKNGKQISTIKHTSWWGIFYIKNNRPYIVSQRHFRQASKTISFAVQSGPRLIINGRTPSLKPGWSFRSALGITKTGEVIIAVTDHLPITTKRFAAILRESTKNGGLACINALNLDGGSSSQMYAQLGTFRLNIPSFAPVSDAILVFPK